MLLITCAFGNVHERTHPLMGVVPLFLIVTGLALKPLAHESNVYELIEHEMVDTTVAVTFVVPELPACVLSPLYVPVNVLLVTDELNMTLQVPVPPESVMVQFVSAPVIATVPVGVPLPVTVAVMGTTPLDGVPAVMVVTVAPAVTFCDELLLLRPFVLV